MTRTVARVLLLVLSIFGSGCDGNESSQPGASTEEPEEPSLNVLLITVDTLRADALGAYGQQRDTSPNLDRLAREGVVFHRAMTSAPNTLPSHASILTARYPYAHGARSNAGYVLSHENETLAEILRAEGYSTAAEISAPVINRRTQLDQGFDTYRDLNSKDIHRKRVSLGRSDGTQTEVEIDERPASDITNSGIEFLGKNRDKPFFLWLHYFDPHATYAAPTNFTDLVPDSPYHAEVRYTDHEIGRLVRNLEMLGLREKTLVVLTSDHGESLGDHGEDTHSHFVFDTTQHVPLLFWGTNSIPSNLQLESLVRTVDIAPTILDFLELPPMDAVQGRSLMPLMTGGMNERADAFGPTAYGETIELHTMFGSSILRSFHRGNWKYVHKLRPELFDLAQDPSELDDLASRHPEKVAELALALREEVLSAPTKPSHAQRAMDEPTRRQLEALGYVASGSTAELDQEATLLEPTGPDAADLVDDVHLLLLGERHSLDAEFQEAVAVFETLAIRHPENPQILALLSRGLIALERYEDAIPLLERAIESDTQDAKVYEMLMRSQEARGHFEEAARAASAALEITPCAIETRMKLSQFLLTEGRHRDRAVVLEEGVSQCPDATELLNNYAYVLATSPDSEVRNGAEAVRLATRVVESLGEENPAVLDTLACAHAEAGDFEQAVNVSRRSVELARKQGMHEAVVSALEANHALFVEGSPVREE